MTPSTTPPTLSQQARAIQVCCFCDQVLASLRCAQCKDAWYCSKQCQVQHWKSGHKKLCKQIAHEKKLAENVDLNQVQEAASNEEKKHNEPLRAKQKSILEQDSEASVPQQFPEGEFPCGRLHAYTDYRRTRYTDEEARERERSQDFHERLSDAREAAEVHRQARAWLQQEARPGKKLIDLCEGLEAKVRHLSEAKFPQAGTAFATGCSVNECAAHYTPNPGDNKQLHQDDIVKFDFGVHKRGTIIDSAWTMSWNPQHNPLLDAVRDATNEGIKTAGIDVRLYDIGAVIQEVMESHEVTIDGKTHPVKCIQNLNGHNIGLYRIHHGKTVPIVKREFEMNVRMEEGEYFAIETFGSINGNGWVDETDNCSHYMLNYDKEDHRPRNNAARKFYKQIQDNFGTLCWCPRYMERLGITGYEKSLKYLVKDDILTPCPPLSDAKGALTAQFEHTLVLRPTCKEVLSRGDDY